MLLLWTISATNEISRLRSDLDEVKQQSKTEDSNSTTNGSAFSEVCQCYQKILHSFCFSINKFGSKLNDLSKVNLYIEIEKKPSRRRF